MKIISYITFLISLLGVSPIFAQDLPDIASKTSGFEKQEGFFTFYWDEARGKLYLEIEELNKDFLYVNGLSAGLGSNDIGLDRKQLGSTRLVRFFRSGPKVMLIQPNLDYRAVSDNPEEAKSVAEAFSSSILWGFQAVAQENEKVLVDITDFFLRDAHGVARRLQGSRQGNFRVDKSRSAINKEMCKAFPKNSEFDAFITFTGNAEGRNLMSVTPTSNSFTLRMHHSFVELPDNKYTPRVMDQRSGYFGIDYQDYATPINQSLTKKFIVRHRLEKKNPRARRSEAVEPIIYYLDRGTPEPIRSALLEGASWWNQAFEAAGYIDAFQVKILPEDADPMDVRYNMINWVHRSTRGWSYGSSVVDPRTGEIIKGHVLLGSLRVRQDFLIAQGLIDAYKNGKKPDPRMEEMALARLRQLSAHEVGHTIGLAHNFAASVNERASVMDYPHPYIESRASGKMNFNRAYDTGIGEWDKRAVIFGYQDFPEGRDEQEELGKIINKTIDMGLLYISDDGARDNGSAHPLAHLWDNGESALEEFRRISELRKQALDNFSEDNIPLHTPMTELERVLVPLYMGHRYQVAAVSKVLGGVEYYYKVRGDKLPASKVVDAATQNEALDLLLSTLEPSFLAIPQDILDLIPPAPIGYSKGREYFSSHTGRAFDPLAAASSSIEHSLSLIFHPQRLARIYEQHVMDGGHMPIGDVFDKVWGVGDAQSAGERKAYHDAISRIVQKRSLAHLMNLAGDKGISQDVSAAAMRKIRQLEISFSKELPAGDSDARAHQQYLMEQIRQFRMEPASYVMPKAVRIPDGSPIGCGGHF
ncbi:MAG: zinc-dependent metalloprotease [Bacteroidia bacterium]|nr:zinc-dependent metalloprotease [Bacteroidia bacterium]